MEDCTYQKDVEPDPEWPLDGLPPRRVDGADAALRAWADVYLAKKGAGIRLAHGYLEAAGARVLSTWLDCVGQRASI